jgi:hypothetical protein
MPDSLRYNLTTSAKEVGLRLNMAFLLQCYDPIFHPIQMIMTLTGSKYGVDVLSIGVGYEDLPIVRP